MSVDIISNTMTDSLVLVRLFMDILCNYYVFYGLFVFDCLVRLVFGVLVLKFGLVWQSCVGLCFDDESVLEVTLGIYKLTHVF